MWMGRISLIQFTNLKNILKILGDNSDALESIILGMLGIAAVGILDKKCHCCNRGKIEPSSHICKLCGKSQ